MHTNMENCTCSKQKVTLLYVRIVVLKARTNLLPMFEYLRITGVCLVA